MLITELNTSVLPIFPALSFQVTSQVFVGHYEAFSGLNAFTFYKNSDGGWHSAVKYQFLLFMDTEVFV